MLTRTESFYDWFGIPALARCEVQPLVDEAALQAEGMTALNDYHALAAIALSERPRNIFEIGTYRGVTSDFFLRILPDVQVVSIAFVRKQTLWDRFRKRGRHYNNTELPQDLIGACVGGDRRNRFVQLIGDSHSLDPHRLIAQHGRFDLIFIDGDHSKSGVRQDTALALQLLTENGTICWHDVNPKPRYLDVRDYAENELELHALATQDTYLGGVACWNRQIERRLSE